MVLAQQLVAPGPTPSQEASQRERARLVRIAVTEPKTDDPARKIGTLQQSLDWQVRVDALVAAGRLGDKGVLSSVLKLAKHGGIRETQKIADLAASYGMLMYPSIHYSTSIGVSASAHFYATIPNITPGSFHQGAALFEHDLIKATPEAEKGYFPIPEDIGIGVTIDPELLERARVDKK